MLGVLATDGHRAKMHGAEMRCGLVQCQASHLCLCLSARILLFFSGCGLVVAVIVLMVAVRPAPSILPDHGWPRGLDADLVWISSSCQNARPVPISACRFPCPVLATTNHLDTNNGALSLSSVSERQFCV